MGVLISCYDLWCIYALLHISFLLYISWLEQLELLVATLIDLDAMDGKSSVSLLAECSSSPDVNTRLAFSLSFDISMKWMIDPVDILFSFSRLSCETKPQIYNTWGSQISVSAPWNQLHFQLLLSNIILIRRWRRFTTLVSNMPHLRCPLELSCLLHVSQYPSFSLFAIVEKPLPFYI